MSLGNYLSDMECPRDVSIDGRLVVKVWDDGCPYCVEYSPIFDKVTKELGVTTCSFKVPRNAPSAFREKYMLENGVEKKSVPATLVFENGHLANIAWGRLHEPQLKAFLTTGELPSKKQPNPQEWATTASNNDLKASMWELGEQIKNNQMVYDIFYNELQRRNNVK
jgi:thiol-disulfide isomerase/thioredoxin